MSSWATTATPTIVKMTRPIASSVISRDVVAQLAQRGEEGRRVEQRRQDDDEDDIGIELDVGDAGDEAQRRAADHEQDRVRDLQW
jgi:hypothetical protein